MVGDVFRFVVGFKLVGENDGDAVVGDVVGSVLGFEVEVDVSGDTFGVLVAVTLLVVWWVLRWSATLWTVRSGSR